MTSMNLTFNIEIENIKLEVTGEYYHSPDIKVGEFAGFPARQDESEFNIKNIFTILKVEYESELKNADITNLLPLFEDKIYPICFDKARELYLDRLSKNE